MPIDTLHPQYSAMVERWQRMRDCQAGSDAIKAAGTAYLPTVAGTESWTAEYRAYKARAMFFNATARTIQALAGALFHRPPKVTAPDAIIGHLEDVTLYDDSLRMIAQELAHEILTVGRAGVLVDHSGDRPFWARYAAESITNWRAEKVGNDPNVVTLVVLRESAAADGPSGFEHVSEDRYRELRLIDGVYHSRLWSRCNPLSTANGMVWTPGEWIVPTRRGRPLEFIPFAFVGANGLTPTVAQPPLLDLVNVNLSHYRSSADLEHGLHFTALPTPWVSGAAGSGALHIGPSVAWMLGPDGRAGMLEFTGAGLEAIRDAMSKKEQLMSVLGARLLQQTPDVSETATAVRIRHSGEAASLATIAHVLSGGLTRLLRWHAWWALGHGDIPLGARVDLTDEFFAVRAQPQEVQVALAAVQAGQMSFETFYGLLERGGWTRPGVSASDERELAQIQRTPTQLSQSSI